MKFSILVCLLALLPLVAAANVPFSSCAANPHWKVQTITASTWPPVSGQPGTVTVSGQLNEVVTGGQFSLTVAVDGFSVINQQAALSTLPNSTWPAQPGLATYSQTISLPPLPSGSALVINGSAVDTNGQTIACIVVQFSIGAEEEEMEEADVEYANAAEEGEGEMEGESEEEESSEYELPAGEFQESATEGELEEAAEAEEEEGFSYSSPLDFESAGGFNLTQEQAEELAQMEAEFYGEEQLIQQSIFEQQQQQQ